MHEYTRIIWTSIDLILVGILIVIFAKVWSLGSEFGEIQQNRLDTIEIMKEERLYMGYDNTVVTGPDIVSLVSRSSGFPEIRVIKADGSIIVWDRSIPRDDPRWEITNIQSIIPVGDPYKSTLTRNTNGEIVSIEFRR